MIWGALDNLPIPSLAARADACRAARADVRIAIIPGGGHWIQYDRPDAVNRLLIDFHRRA
jgi:2-hydroxy-6-oxonona-2,4-dienedioate hydrolase